MITKKQRGDEVRAIELEFGFKVRYRNVARFIRAIAEEVHILRKTKEMLKSELLYSTGRIRELEDQLLELDRSRTDE